MLISAPRRFRQLTGLLIALGTLGATPIGAQQPGVIGYSAPEAFQSALPFFASPQGFGFRPTQDVWLTALGYFVPTSMPYDPNAVTVSQLLYESDESDRLTLLASTNGSEVGYRIGNSIGAPSGVYGTFQYADLASPVFLRSGQLHVLTHFGPMQVLVTPPGMQLAPDFILSGGYTVHVQPGPSRGQRFDFPLQTGAAFEYVLVTTPEPSSLLLLTTGLAGFVVIAGFGRRSWRPKSGESFSAP